MSRLLDVGDEDVVGGKLGAALRYLRVMTLSPDALSSADVRKVRQAGVSDAALRDAIHVALMFNIINRVADALGFRIPDDAAFAADAKMLLQFGYKL